jgi:hypothetical protein
MRQLDGCLAQLEDANERNEVLVSAPVARRLQPHLAGVQPGMPIVDAIETALREQARHLETGRRTGAGGTFRVGSGREVPPASPAPSNDRPGIHITAARPVEREQERGGADTGGPAEGHKVVSARLDPRAARELTERIRTAIGEVASLLLEAHDGSAWLAIGYATWEEYVREEFHLSKQRSFQLLDHARFLRVLKDATGGSTAVDLPERLSRDLKHDVATVAEAVRIQTAFLAPNAVRLVVGRVVREHRRRALQLKGRVQEGPLGERGRPTPTGGEGTTTAPHAWTPNGQGATVIPLPLLRLQEALATILNMPPIDELVARTPDDFWSQLRDMDVAARWLADFARQRPFSARPYGEEQRRMGPHVGG